MRVGHVFRVGCLALLVTLTACESNGSQQPPSSRQAQTEISEESGQPKFTEFPLTHWNGTGPWNITAGPPTSDSMWFISVPPNAGGARIGRISTSTGAIKDDFKTYDDNADLIDPDAIAAGPDGNLWFTDRGAHGIGRIDPSGGGFTHWTLNTAAFTGGGIAAGPAGDASLWFTEAGDANSIGRIDMTGHISEYRLPNHGPATVRVPHVVDGPWGIAAGPEGDPEMWFTEPNANRVGRIDEKGKVKEYDVTTKRAGPYNITAGPDGAMWFTEDHNAIGRIDVKSGRIREFALDYRNHSPRAIVSAGGGLWFAEYDGYMIGRISPSGSITGRRRCREMSEQEPEDGHRQRRIV